MQISGSRTLAAAISAALLPTFGQAAIITVTDLSDGSVPGECTLRDAIQAANTNTSVNACIAGDPGQDEITFEPGLSGTITLTNGDLEVTEPAIITNGPGGPMTIQGAGTRLFTIGPNAPTEIIGFELQGGSTTGSYQHGGAIYSQSDLHLEAVALFDNATNGTFSYGGAVAVSGGDLSMLLSSVIYSRTYGDNSEGGAIFVEFGNLELEFVDVLANYTDGEFSPGGAISVFLGDVYVNSGFIADNETRDDFSRGGGIIVQGGLEVRHSEINDNRVLGDFGAGGGLYAYGDTIIDSSSLIDNVVVGSNGRAGALAVSDYGVSASIVNSTISGNEVDLGEGAAIYFSGYFGELSLLHSTIAYNHSDSGGDLFIGSLGFNTITVSAVNTILHNDGATGISLCNQSLDAATSANNIATDSSCGTDSLIGNAPVTPGDLDLQPLASNGGMAPTHALGPFSPAIDAADGGGCADPRVNGVDQRGAQRPGVGSAACDIGAYEFQGAAAPDWDIQPSDLDFGNIEVGNVITGVLQVISTGNDDFELVDITLSSPPPSVFDLAGGNCAVGMTLGPGDVCEIEIEFAPLSAGDFTAVLAVESTFDSRTVPLAGRGVIDAIFGDRFQQ